MEPLPRLALRRLAAFLACGALAGAASAQTIYVDTSADTIDFGGLQQVADLPGPDGKISLPEAGLASDNTPGVQTIGFHIPQSDWDYQWLFPGRAVLRPFLGFRVFDTAILDGTTQTAFTGETNPDGGAEVVIWQESYLIDNVGGAMFGFDHSSIHLSGGSGNVVRSNTSTNIELYDSHDNLIGGAGPGEGNVGSFVIQVDRSNGNRVLGNTVSRVRILGWVGGGQTALNNRVGGPLPGERNLIVGFGTWNSEGVPGGYAVEVFDTAGTILENNQIGTTPDGLQQGHGATTTGVLFEGENSGVLLRGNRIAGILGRGIGPHFFGLIGTGVSIVGTGDGITLQGNTFGLDANEQPLLGSVTGISTTNYYLGPVQHLVIGGPGAGEANEIAGQLDAGIVVANSYAGVRISGNSIHDNGGLGIDLIPPSFQSGVTDNDPGDLDTGGNGLQNFPVLTEALRAGNGVVVRGTLDSAPNRAYRVEVFANPACDPSGHGEGEVFLGFADLLTDAAGAGAFSLSSATAVPPGWVVAATATDTVSGDSSEFSACADLLDGFRLEASPLVRGQVATLGVQQAIPGERVDFLYSLRGVGAGPCPPLLGGVCLDLLAPVVRLGDARADALGTASLIVNVPTGAPLVAVHLQAVARRGAGGVDSVKSNTVSAVIQP